MTIAEKIERTKQDFANVYNAGYDKGIADTATEVDQTYNPESLNAQSGVAVAEALDGLLGDIKPTINQNEEKNIVLIPRANNQYYYNELTSLSLSFGDSSLGDLFYISFKSGETATSLTIDSTSATFNDFIPETNSFIEICGMFNGYKWILVFNQVGEVE